MPSLSAITALEKFNYQEEEIQYPHPTVFSDYIVANKFELDSDELKTIQGKIKRSVRFDKNWNGENTFPPSRESVLTVYDLLRSYQGFIKSNLIRPASVQLYPLNEGGFGLELITEKPKVVLYVENDSLRPGSAEPLIQYYVRDRDTTEQEGEISISRLSTLFFKLHFLNKDV